EPREVSSCVLDDVVATVPFAMQRQIDVGESKLAHLRVGGAESFRALHFLEQILWNRSAGFEMAGQQIQRFALPAPVLHDLRGQLNEIPRDAGAGEAAHFDA